MEQHSINEMIEDVKNVMDRFRAANFADSLANDQAQELIIKEIELSVSEFHNRELINWRRARSIIEHENILVNHRITWLLLSQGALLAAFANLYQKMSDKSVTNSEIFLIPLLFLSILGILISVNLFSHLRNAAVQLSRVTEWWYQDAFNTVAEANKISNTDDKKKAQLYEAAEKIYERLNKNHPPLHLWYSIDFGDKKGFHFVMFRSEALPFYFITLWAFLIFGVFFGMDDQMNGSW